jgi:hypothetical protein
MFTWGPIGGNGVLASDPRSTPAPTHHRYKISNRPPGDRQPEMTVELRSHNYLANLPAPPLLRDIIRPTFDESSAAPVPRTTTDHHQSILSQSGGILVRRLEWHKPVTCFMHPAHLVGLVWASPPG